MSDSDLTSVVDGVIWLSWLLDMAGGDDLKALDMLVGMTVSYAGQLFQAGKLTHQETGSLFAEVASECDLWLLGHSGEWGPKEWVLAASCLLNASFEMTVKERASVGA